MNRHLLALAGALAMLSPAHALDIQLPAETATLHPGASPGAQSAAQCLMCHSVDYLSTQPPMPLGFWEAEVKKMVADGAPIAPDQAQLIIQYLNQAYPAPGGARRREVGRTGKARGGPGPPAMPASRFRRTIGRPRPAVRPGRFSRPACSNPFRPTPTCPPSPRPLAPALRVSTLSPVLPGVPDHLDRQPVRQPGHLGAVRRRGLDHHHRTEQPAAGRHDPGGRRLPLVALSILTGVLADNYDRRKVMLAGMGLELAGACSSPSWPSPACCTRSR